MKDRIVWDFKNVKTCKNKDDIIFGDVYQGISISDGFGKRTCLNFWKMIKVW